MILNNHPDKRQSIKPLKSVEEFNELTKEARQKKYKFTNCFLLPDAIEHYLKNNRISYEWNETSLALYCDEETYIIVYFYAENEKEFEIGTLPKSAVVRYIFWADRAPDFTMLEKSMESSSFEFYEKTQQIKFDLTEENFESMFPLLEKIEKNGFRIEQCPLSRRSEFEKEMNTFVPYFHIPYYDDEEWERRSKDNNYLCAFNENEDMCAVMQGEFGSRTVDTKGGGTNPNFRRQGLFVALKLYICYIGWKNGKTLNYGWWRATNEVAHVTHRSYGAEVTGREALEFFRK